MGKVKQGLGLGAALGLLASGGAAEPPAPGCYMRDYSDAHLAAHPAQVADRIVLEISEQATGTTVGNLWVTFADQGHAARSGAGHHRMWQFLVCWSDGGTPRCGVECDGGTMEITRQDASGLSFRTGYLLVGPTDQCGGAVDLAERPGETVSYRLNAVAGTLCEGERPTP